MTTTTNFGLTVPTNGGDLDSWGLENNAVIVAYDNLIAQLSQGRNRLINGDFRVNQRAYVSAATLAGGSYGHDRWKGGAGGGTYSFTQAKSDTTITIASGKTLMQVVEDVNVEGGSYILSWAGTAQGRVAKNGGSTTGAYAASPIAITNADAGETITVEFNAGTLGLAQLEAGTVATPFERVDFATNLQRCQRYCYVWRSTGAYDTVGFGQNVTGSGCRTLINFPQKLRGEPTFSTTGNFGFGENLDTGTSNQNAGISMVGAGYGAAEHTNSAQVFVASAGLPTLWGYVMSYNEVGAALIFDADI